MAQPPFRVLPAAVLGCLRKGVERFDHGDARPGGTDLVVEVLVLRGHQVQVREAQRRQCAQQCVYSAMLSPPAMSLSASAGEIRRPTRSAPIAAARASITSTAKRTRF
ncbi:hypothetical protein GCM10010377_70410 [Streptomyces viridiviolaceus]|nr:hypothetical protein GCM10010377_70410 [Streptomyces viridiviolaceus]